MSGIGVMVCGHGSRDDEAVREFAAVAAGVARRLPHYPVESGFLEFARPIIRDGLDRLRARGVDRILALPGMLFAAGHVKNDIPSVLNTYQAQHPGLRIDYGRDLAVDLNLLRVAGQRIEEAEAVSSRRVPRAETLLVVVGRGTSDPDANGNIAKVARMLWEGMGFGWMEVCYSGVTFPLVAPGLVATSVFVGGGTPSLVPAEHLARILRAVPVAAGAEVTVECNPETVTRELLDTSRGAGVTRLSFGVQSTSPHVLRALGLPDMRVYTALRFGVGRYNTGAEIDSVVERVAEAAAAARSRGSWPRRTAP